MGHICCVRRGGGARWAAAAGISLRLADPSRRRLAVRSTDGDALHAQRVLGGIKARDSASLSLGLMRRRILPVADAEQDDMIEALLVDRADQALGKSEVPQRPLI